MQNDLKKAAEVLKGGGILLYPSDTLWGIGCDATNAEAVEKLNLIRKQTSPESMVVLMENPALLERYVNEVPEVAWDLVEISTSPLTVIYPGAKNLAPNLLLDDGSIAIRFTKEEFTVQLLQRFRRPIVFAPASLGQEASPLIFDEIPEEIKSRVDYTVEYRQNDIPSTRPAGVIKLWPGGRIEILRK